MKTLITIALSCFALSAHAFGYEVTQVSDSCKARVESAFTKLKASAVSQLVPAQRPELEKVVIKYVSVESINRRLVRAVAFDSRTGKVVVADRQTVGGDDGDYSDARADIRSRAILITEEACANQPTDITMLGLIAHEFGHFETYFIYPEVGHDFDTDDEGKWKYTYAAQEEYANMMGSHVMRDAHIDNNEYLAVLDKKCDAGRKYSCDRAKAWRLGMRF
jgi:hypothetical protein